MGTLKIVDLNVKTSWVLPVPLSSFCVRPVGYLPLSKDLFCRTSNSALLSVAATEERSSSLWSRKLKDSTGTQRIMDCASMIAIYLLVVAMMVAVVSSLSSVSQVSLGSLSVSPIGLGSLNIGTDDSTLVELLETLPSQTLIDTAEIYGKGQAETRLAQANARKTSQNKILWATKFAPQVLRRDATSVVKACRESCDRLQVDSIDLYQLHYSDNLQPLVQLGLAKNQDEQFWDGLAMCYQEGLAKNVGVCNYGPTMIKQAYNSMPKRGVPLVSNQISYNLMRKGIVEETKNVCDDLGIKVLSYSPLGKGLLSGKYDPNDPTTLPSLEDSSRYYRYKRCLKELTGLCDCLRQVSQQRQGQSWASLVYQWHLSQHTLPIAGARNARQWIPVQEALEAEPLSNDQLVAFSEAATYDVSSTKEFNLV